ncbi:MAG: BON domain-containing protein [Vicinamibacterales bacterium]
MRCFIALLLAGVVLLPACASRSKVGVSTGITHADGDSLALIARVKTALLNDAIVGRRRIDVHVTGDQVRLTGRVASAAERDRAVAIAGAVPGVSSVTSDLAIQP